MNTTLQKEVERSMPIAGLPKVLHEIRPGVYSGKTWDKGTIAVASGRDKETRRDVVILKYTNPSEDSIYVSKISLISLNAENFTEEPRRIFYRKHPITNDFKQTEIADLKNVVDREILGHDIPEMLTSEYGLPCNLIRSIRAHSHYLGDELVH